MLLYQVVHVSHLGTQRIEPIHHREVPVLSCLGHFCLDSCLKTVEALHEGFLQLGHHSLHVDVMQAIRYPPGQFDEGADLHNQIAYRVAQFDRPLATLFEKVRRLLHPGEFSCDPA